MRKCTVCGIYMELYDTRSLDLCRGIPPQPCPFSGKGQVQGVEKESDKINPQHYKNHPSGIECIEIARHFSFNLGNAIKYLWRADEKGSALEDLKKARWYIEDEIKKREKQK